MKEEEKKERNHFHAPEWNIKLLNDVLSLFFVRFLSICLFPLIPKKREKKKHLYVLHQNYKASLNEWMKNFRAKAYKLWAIRLSYIEWEAYKKTGLNASLRAKHKSDQLKMSKQEKANIILCIYPPSHLPPNLFHSLLRFSSPLASHLLSSGARTPRSCCVLMVFRRKKNR